MREFLTDHQILQTTTEGYDPKSNGLAERFVGILKQRATAYLTHTDMPLRFWYWAMQQAAYVYRCRALDIELPKESPTFGNMVLIRDRKGEQTSFRENQWRQCSLVGTSRLAKGHMLSKGMVIRDGC